VSARHGVWRGRSSRRDHDLVAVADVRGEVHRDEVSVAPGAARQRERVAGAGFGPHRVHPGAQDVTGNVDHRLRRGRSAAAPVAAGRLGQRGRPAACGSSRRRHGAQEHGATDRGRRNDGNELFHACPITRSGRPG
jgi:hypothetical protein